MNLYNISLFIHILALFTAGIATGVTKLAEGRRRGARTVSEALDWHNILLGASRLYPISFIAFVVTGGVMMSFGHIRFWSSGFIVVGLIGAVIMMAGGIYLGKAGAALKQVLEGLVKQDPSRPVPMMVPPTLVKVIPILNTVLGIAIAFVMVTKPLSILVASSIVAGAGLLSVIAVLRSGGSAARMHAPSPATERRSAEVQQSIG